VRRSYSLAAAPAADHMLELHVRAVDGGVMSRYWFEQAKLNDLLRLHGPLGTFFLRDIAGCDLVFLATGTGMAPVKAMLEDLAQRDGAEQPRSISVYWGARAEVDFYWDPNSLGLPLRHVPVHSRPGPDWAGTRGHVQQAALAQVLPLDEVRVYACGSDAMIQSARAAFLAAGLADRHFHADAFVSSS
jgi:CDP-4-dehydro-6-deoxyglucose reductase, E3